MTVHTLTGNGAPQVAPPSLSAHYLDLDTDTQYLAKGTTDASDWVVLGGGGGGSGGDGLTKDNFVDLIPRGYFGNGANSEGSCSLALFNRKDLGCLFYGGSKAI